MTLDQPQAVRRFEELGVTLICETAEMIELLEDKAAAYERFSKAGINVPEYRVVSTAAQFEAAYAELNEKYDKLCIKCVNDKGGQSFRIITETKDEYTQLMYYPTFSIGYDSLNRILNNKGTFKPMMLMPLLNTPEVEVSADCFDCVGKRIIIPRFKYSGHVEKIIFDSEIIGMVNKVIDIVSPKYICDVQFRFLNGTPYLLEVNARMSGGLPLSCAAAGVNIPALALKKALGKAITPEDYSGFTAEEKTISFVEVPAADRHAL